MIGALSLHRRRMSPLAQLMHTLSASSNLPLYQQLQRALREL
jgi:GntR family transcriptional regulator